VIFSTNNIIYDKTHQIYAVHVSAISLTVCQNIEIKHYSTEQTYTR